MIPENFRSFIGFYRNLIDTRQFDETFVIYRPILHKIPYNFKSKTLQDHCINLNQLVRTIHSIPICCGKSSASWQGPECFRTPRLIVKSYSNKILSNIKISCTDSKVWFIQSACYASMYHNTLDSYYWIFQSYSLFLLNCSYCVIQIDNITFLKCSYWVIQLDSPTFLEIYYWDINLDWYLKKNGMTPIKVNQNKPNWDIWLYRMVLLYISSYLEHFPNYYIDLTYW